MTPDATGDAIIEVTSEKVSVNYAQIGSTWPNGIQFQLKKIDIFIIDNLLQIYYRYSKTHFGTAQQFVSIHQLL